MSVLAASRVNSLGRMTAPDAMEPQDTKHSRVREVIRAETDLFYELVRPCERQLFAAAFSILRSQVDAEEVAQEAVLKAFRARSAFRGDCKFSTWLIQITINEAKTRLRKDRRHLFESIEGGKEGDYIPRDFADWRAIPSQALEQRELREVLTQALNDLPLNYRLVMVLRDVEQFSIDETARILGISIANVKIRLLRARLRMRDALALSPYARRHKDR